jgi:hypothetical protein
MPKYIVSSDGPIHVREVGTHEPVDPGYGIEAPEHPSTGHPPGRPGHPIAPTLPPRDEWPPLPPALKPGVGLPIPPTPEFPMVPIEPNPPSEGGTPTPPIALPPGMVWPPVKPELPDLEGNYLALAFVYTSRTGGKLRWIVIDPDELPPKPSIPGRPQPK